MTPLAVETFISSGFDGMPKNAVFPHVLPLKEGEWLGAESNRRHVDFQSTALPTELPSRHSRQTVCRVGLSLCNNVVVGQAVCLAFWPRQAMRLPYKDSDSSRGFSNCWIALSSYNRAHEEAHFHQRSTG